MSKIFNAEETLIRTNIPFQIWQRMRRTAALSKSQGIILQTHLVFFHFSLSFLWLSNVVSRGRWLLKSGLVLEGLYVRTVVRYLASLSLRFIYPCNIGISFAAYCAVCTQVHYWIVSSSFSSWISIVCSKCFTSDHFRHFRHFGYTQMQSEITVLWRKNFNAE